MFLINKEYKTIYADNVYSLIEGINKHYNLGVELKSSYFGSGTTILHFENGDVKPFYGNHNLCDWVMNVIDCTKDFRENYITKFDSKFKLNSLPETVTEKEEIKKVIETEFINNITEESFETSEEVEDVVDISEKQTLQTPNFKAMKGPKWSKEAIIKEAEKYGIVLEDAKKPEMLVKFEEEFKNLN